MESTKSHAQCDGIIDLRFPSRSERVRGFQPPWRTVYVYRCKECGGESRVRASAYRGNVPVPGVGGIRCGRLVAELAGGEA